MLIILLLFIEVKALQGLCYLLYVYSTKIKSSVSIKSGVLYTNVCRKTVIKLQAFIRFLTAA